MPVPVPVVLTFLGNIAGAVLGKFGDHLFAPIQRKFKYMCCFDSNITELEAQLEMFQRTRQGVQLRVDNDRANVRIIDPNVEAWLRSADEVTSEVDGITQEKPKVKEGCLNGWCPNLKLRYSLSRKAVKKTEVVVKLQAAGISYTQTSYSPPPTSLETIPNGDFTGFESRRFTMEKIIKALKHDEIKLIGICGMGGTGKTTMVKEIAKRAKEESLFDEVAIVVVGQERDPTNVQACTAEMLSLKDLRDTKSPIVRANLLRRRLLQDNKKILVILDDIWAEMDLEDMGFPLRGANKNFKMLYTSRTQHLWHDLQIKKEIPLDLLTEDEAWKLFREKVGDLADARDLQPIAKKIANECGCLPLALVLVGGALSKKNGRNAIKEMWEGILDRLTCASNIRADEGLYSSLELSYEYLEYRETKRLFLLCCLFKEDENISIEDLGRYGFGLSFFEDINEMEKVRRQILLIIDDLKSRYLLLDGDVEGCVKVHDVVRDMGISIASREGALVSHGALSKWPRKDNYKHYIAISVISEKIKELPGGLTYPNLEFLMLQSRELEKLQSDFFEGMEELKVLVLKYFCGILTFQPLRNLTTLSLEGFGGVLDNVCAIGDLVNLEILSFRYSKIKELPEEIAELVNLRLLDLHATGSLERIPRGVISRLERLEELYICDSGFKNWEGEGKENANLRELESLSNLNTLEICILSNDKAPIFIPPIFGELKMYKLVLIGELYRLRTWEFKPYKRLLAVSCSTPIPLYPLIPLLRSSDCLVLDGEECNDLVRELLLRDGVDGLQQLKHLKISSCDTPECLANTMNLFPILEKLYLWSLSYLRQICRGPVPTGSFRELTTLDVRNCGLLENLFELPIGGCFAQLKILTIMSCIMMKEVFRKQQREDVPDATKRLEFPKLETLELKDLPSLVGFCGGIDQIDFPKLKRMDLKSLGKFKRLFHNNSSLSSNSSEEDNFGFLSLFPQKVSLPTLEVLNISKLENQETLGHDLLSMSALSKLKKFSVHYCGKLLCVFPSQLVLMLQNLERLTVEGCHLLEVVFELEGVDTKEPNQEILSALKVVTLRDLPKLIYISKGDPIGFNYVQNLEIDGCHSLRYVFAPTVMKSIPQLRQLKIQGSEMLSRIVAEENGTGESSVDEVEFPQLERLELWDLPSLVSFCRGIDQIKFPKLEYMHLRSVGKFKRLINNNSNLSSNSEQKDNFGFLSLFPHKVSLPNLKVLKISKLENLETLGHDSLSVGSLSKLEEFSVGDCGKLLCVFPSQLLPMLRNLERLTVESCHLLEVVFELEGVDTKEPNPEILPALNVVKLRDLPKLIYISRGDPIGFKYVQTLEIAGCHSLRYVFAPTMMKSIPQLRELKIQGCEMLSRIVAEENGMGESSVDEVKFPQLERLELQDLPNLVSLFPNVNTALPKSTDSHHNPMQPESLFNEKVTIPSLKYLKLLGLKNVSDLCCSELPNSSFSKLEKLEVIRCTSLRTMFHPSMAGGLLNLKELLIHFCWTLEAVVGKEEEVEGGHERKINKVEFPQLKRLELHGLPNLVSLFLNGNIALPKCSFSKLEKLEVIRCMSLRTMFHPSTVGGLLNLKELLIRFCSTLEAVVGKEKEVKGGHERKIDKVEFPQLERLVLQDLPNLVSLFPNVNTALPKSTDSHHNPMQPESLFNEKVTIPSLKYLELLRLKNVSDLCCCELPNSSFSKLEKLKVIHCTSLRTMFHPSMAGGLLNLKELLIHFCSTLEAVVGKEEEVEGGHERKIYKVEFPQLKRLELHDLPNLVSLFPNVNTALPKSTDSHHNPMQPESLFNEKVAIPSLKYLELHGLKNVSDLCCCELPNSSFSKLEKLKVIRCTSLRTMFHPSMAGGLLNLKELLIHFCSNLEAVVGKEEEVEGYERKIDKVEFPQLESLELCDLPSLVGFCRGIDQIDFPKLERVLLKSLGKFKRLFNSNSNLSSNSDQKDNFSLLSVFPHKVAILSIKYLELVGLKNVSDLGCSELPSSSFSKLENLKVIGCPSLRNMFHPSMAGDLVNLKKLLIEDCSTLEAVVGKEEEVGGGHERKIDKVEFPQLERLELHDLPNLVSLFPNVNIALPKSTDRLHNPMQPQSLINEKVAIPSLNYLRLLGLKNVSDLWCSELPSSSFSKLENLKVIGCASLRNMFHPSMSRGLVNLKELLIEVCSTLEVVVGKEEEVVGGGHGSKTDKTLFPLLGKLKLDSLPNLKRFCNSTHPLELPKLSQMDILFCPSMDAFSSEPVCAPNLTLPGISWNGDLNNAIQFLRKDDVPCLIEVEVVKSKYSNRDDPMARSMGKLRTLDDVTDNFKAWQVAETQCYMVATPDSIYGAHKVARLLYTNIGNGVLALGCNGIMTRWKSGGNQHNQSGMATASVVPQQWQPADGLMTNDVTGVNIEEAVPCIALSKNGSYVISACGGKISLFNIVTFKVMTKFMPPSPASTFLAFYPQDNDVIAIGMEDSTIRIYNVRVDEVKCILKGHQNRITGLAFSTNLNILVSSGTDAQLCIWSIDTWKKLKSVPIELPTCKVCNGDTSVEFHSDLIRLLVSHETQLAIYDASKMDRMRQWVPQDVLPAPIFCAAYSCDSQLVYTSFCDGNIGVFDADSLTLQSRIAPSAYLSPTLLSGSQAVCLQFVLAAHPHEPNQFAIGLTDVFVKVMEPPESEGNRGSSPHVDNGMLNGRTASSSNTSNQTPDQKGEQDVVVDEDLDEDVDEDALITTRTRTRTATTGTHDEEEDLEEL